MGENDIRAMPLQGRSGELRSEPVPVSAVPAPATIAAHTPGPWLMASKPSSIVGWPIVAPQALGRVVCSLNYADKAAFGGPQPGDRAFNAESMANGLLIAAAPALYEALEAMVAEKCDYMLLNHLGDPEAQHTIKQARATLNLARGAA